MSRERKYHIPPQFQMHIDILKASDVSEADVVICSYRLLYSQIYLKRREAMGRAFCKRKQVKSNSPSGALRRQLALQLAESDPGTPARHLRFDGPPDFGKFLGKAATGSPAAGRDARWFRSGNIWSPCLSFCTVD